VTSDAADRLSSVNETTPLNAPLSSQLCTKTLTGYLVCHVTLQEFLNRSSAVSPAVVSNEGRPSESQVQRDLKLTSVADRLFCLRRWRAFGLQRSGDS
jgi:hypothetical protein